MVESGKRQARLWDEVVWVSVLSIGEEGSYRIVPDEGEEFTVAAESDDDLQDSIEKELRRQFPDG